MTLWPVFGLLRALGPVLVLDGRVCVAYCMGNNCAGKRAHDKSDRTRHGATKDIRLQTLEEIEAKVGAVGLKDLRVRIRQELDGQSGGAEGCSRGAKGHLGGQELADDDGGRRLKCINMFIESTEGGGIFRWDDVQQVARERGFPESLRCGIWTRLVIEACKEHGVAVLTTALRYEELGATVPHGLIDECLSVINNDIQRMQPPRAPREETLKALRNAASPSSGGGQEGAHRREQCGVAGHAAIATTQHLVPGTRAPCPSGVECAQSRNRLLPRHGSYRQPLTESAHD